MTGRYGWLLAALVLALAGAAVGGYFILKRPAPLHPATADADIDADHKISSLLARGGNAHGTDAPGTGEAPTDGAANHDHKTTEGDNPSHGDGQGASAAVTAPAAHPHGLVIADIDRDTINEPAKGWLLIRVHNRDGNTPMSGVMVYLPVLDQSLPVIRGEVAVPPGLAPLGRRTNIHGVAAFNADELAALAGAAVSVLITCNNFVDLYEPFSIPDLRQGAEVTYHLFPGVRVTGRARIKRGGPAPFIEIAVLQTSRRDPNAPPKNAFTFTTGHDGEFELTVASANLYQFTVNCRGYTPYRSTLFDFKRGERTVSIVLEQARGLAGVVVDIAGAPVAGARVEIAGDETATVTNELGEFMLDCVRDAIYTNEVTLRTSAAGLAPDVRKVLVNDRGLRVTLLSLGSVRGVVVNEAGLLVVGAAVSCVYNDGLKDDPPRLTTTGENGAFTFTGFGKGVLKLWAMQGDLATDVANVGVEAGRDQGPLRLELRKAAGISVRVMVDGGGPLKGATVELAGKARGLTDDKGVHDFGPMMAGEYIVRIVNAAEITDPVLAKLALFTVDGKTFYHLPVEQKITLKTGDTVVAGFNVRPFEAKTHRDIKVRVLGRADEDTAGIRADIRPVMGNPPKGVQRPQAQVFTFDLKDRVHEFSLQLVDGMSYEATLEHPRYFKARLAPETLKDVPDGATVEVLLEQALIIKGYVRDSEGNGLEGVGISRDRNNIFNFAARTDIHGYFEIGQLRPGDYVISAFKTTYHLEQKRVLAGGTDPEPLLFQLVSANEIRLIVMDGGQRRPGARVHIYRNETDRDHPDAVRVHFDIGTTDAEGVKFINFHWTRNYQVVALFEDRIACVNFDNLREAPAREFTLVMEPAFKLSGRVVDDTNGQPVPDCVLRAHVAPPGGDKTGNYFQVRCGGDGIFQITVPAGRYYFFVPRNRVYERLDASISPVTAPSEGVLLRLVPRSDIEGNWAQVVSFSTPLTMTAGSEYMVSVTMRNAGSTTWGPAGARAWRLGSQAPQDNNTWGLGRVHLAQGTAVRPGETYTFNFNVRAPQKAGTYAMCWRMVQEMVEWFGDYTTTLNITVTQD